MNARHSLAFTIAALSLVALHARADSDRDRERDRDRDRTTTVDCAAGDTVARALTRGDERKSLTILINGSCSEHVVINRSDIKLAAAAPGATISANGVNGIHIVYGSTALVAANQVTGNGTDPSAAFSGNGVNIANATANVIGGNTISGNAGPGINLRSGSVNLGDANFDMPTVNTITGNGNPTFTGGISGFLGSALSIRDAVISNNVGFGVVLAVRSTAQIGNSTIQNNRAIPGAVPGTVIAGDGIQLQRGSAVLGITPNSSVTQNEGFGVNCTDLESSVANTAALGIGINARGGVACTGF